MGFYRIWAPWKTDLLAVMFVFTPAPRCAEAPARRKPKSWFADVMSIVSCRSTPNQRVNINANVPHTHKNPTEHRIAPPLAAG